MMSFKTNEAKSNEVRLSPSSERENKYAGNGKGNNSSNNNGNSKRNSKCNSNFNSNFNNCSGNLGREKADRKSNSNNRIAKQKKRNNYKYAKKLINFFLRKKEYFDKYQEDKLFIDNTENYNTNKLVKDSSHFIFFFNLFVRGRYLNMDSLEEALMKDNKKKNIQKKIKTKIQENIIEAKTSTKRDILFLNGKHTRLLICNYLKVFLNNVQNEDMISTNFHIIDYAELYENRENSNNNYFSNHNVKIKQKEQSTFLSSPGSLNHNGRKNDASGNTGGVSGSTGSTDDDAARNRNENRSKGGMHAGNNDESGSNLNGDNKIDKLTNDDLMVRSSSMQNGKCIEINEFIYNRILTNFVTELKGFFFSIIAKVRSNKLIATLIVIFSELCLHLTPYYLNIINFIDILNDFANAISVSYIKRLIIFFQNNKNQFIEKYKEFQNSIIFNDPVKIQSVGARLIGFIKILQKKNSLNNKKKESFNIFFLNLLLSECLPINHLGFCNRQSVKNNCNFLFYDSLEHHTNSLNDELILFDEYELTIRENIKNYKKVKTIIHNEINSRFFSDVSSSKGTKRKNPTVGLTSSVEETEGKNEQPLSKKKKNVNSNSDKQEEKEVTDDEQASTSTTTMHSVKRVDEERNRSNNGKDAISKDGSNDRSKDKSMDRSKYQSKDRSKERSKERGKQRKRTESSSRRSSSSSSSCSVGTPDRHKMGNTEKNLTCRKLFNNVNEANKNYKVYLSYIYLVIFVRFPEMFASTNKIELDDVYKSFKLFYAFIKNLKKENIMNISVIREYLHNSDFDFLGNRHIYNIVIRDENFLNVFFFNILLVLNYLNCELHILENYTNLPAHGQDNGMNDISEKSTVIKTKEINNRVSGTHNNLETSHLSTTHSQDQNRNCEDKNASTNSRMHKGPQKSGKENSNTNSSNLASNNNNNNISNINSNSNNNSSLKNKENSNKIIPGSGKGESSHLTIASSRDVKNRDNKLVSEKTKKIMYMFIKDLINYLESTKNSYYYRLLLLKEYCWYTWKKQLTGKPSKDNSDIKFEFKSWHNEMKMEKKNAKEVVKPSSNNSINVKKEHDYNKSADSSYPVQNLIYIIENFELLNKRMKSYYELNKNNKNLMKNMYKYTKFMQHYYAYDNNITNNSTEGEVPTGNDENMAKMNPVPSTTPSINNMNNFLIEINKIYLRREAEFWELDESDAVTNMKKSKNETNILIEKLIEKLEDYKKKMHIDNDPINEIEESEKSKNNPVFKFRLAKLFILKYIDLYAIVKNKEFSTDCNFLYNLMLKMDKNLEKKKNFKENKIVLNEEEDQEKEVENVEEQHHEGNANVGADADANAAEEDAGGREEGGNKISEQDKKFS
ncbi:conserved Plasmodium protein, unknown function [Plasmodium malariae]|uniref:Uncharacterized protein n=1 Tax=Plasmodium malariae TaxID=5858 RepID=A0A1A8VRM2_PLAMA|nr:conserved Plasmodium protein, unknown function [Plasmodium malariae]